MSTTGELLDQALRHHQGGDFAAAEPLYRQIIQADAGHADAHHLLGILANQTGRQEAALSLIRQAIALAPATAAYHFNLGNLLKDQGQATQAILCYRQALALNPQFVEALVNLAGALRDHGQLADAAACYRQALSGNPLHAGLHNNLGLTLRDLGLLPEAIASYRQALRIQPLYADALDNLGIALRDQGNLTEAGACCRQALVLNPIHPQAHNSLGIILQDEGKIEEAIASYRQALMVNPKHASALHNLGCALLSRGQVAEAAECLRQALQHKPHYALAHFSLGNALKLQGLLVEAIESYREALRLHPQNADVFQALGSALVDHGDLSDAIECFRQALRLNPRMPNVHVQLAKAIKCQQPPESLPSPSQEKPAQTTNPRHADAHNNLGVSLMDEGKAEDAAQCFRHALSINPRHADAHNNLSNALLRLGRLDEACQHNDQALRINPVHGTALWDRSLLALLQGNFLEGWPDYERRWGLPQVAPRNFSRPRWDGRPLDGKTILLHAEQGLGDTVQFVRFASLVKERGGTIILACQPPLVRLMARVPAISTVVAMGTQLPPYDVHAPLLSLPGIFETSVETIPRQVPYLIADPQLIGQWRQELTTLCTEIPLKNRRLNVGIAWQGNPKNQIDRYRSLPLAHFAPLALIPGVNLVSLQVGHGSEQIDSAPFTVTDIGKHFDSQSLDDAAATIMNMDLMVTSDSSIAHLAGALGVPIMVALGLMPDWRWLLERGDCPWYPTMQLFRQRKFGDWDEVFARIAAEVSKIEPQDHSPAWLDY